jgi:hypothetical protein
LDCTLLRDSSVCLKIPKQTQAHNSGGVQFYSFGPERGGGGIFFLGGFFSLVLNVFPSCSHRVPQVPKLFPQDIPNCNSILSHIIITLQNFIYKKTPQIGKMYKSIKNKGEF